MKSTLLVLCLLSVWLSAAHAELRFPDFASLSPAQQQAWGYQLKIDKGSLGLTISPAAAKAYEGARLFLRDEQKRIMAEIHMDMIRLPDGSLSLNMNLFENLRGSAELIIYSSRLEGAVAFPNFGGFTFHLSSPQP